ncbi:MAG: enoyl-CoA hydratase/isomerase family protein [Ectothiorhodospiraceae bacterium]|nr:enoyl-CoA hydratase/isomerase family protein [Ectothiorhodospiraceae bacterium]
MEIRKVAVLGAGVMGSGIAAQVANAGVPVLLLDVVPAGATDRNALAAGAVERMLGTEPAPFMDRRNARLVTPGNLEDDLDALADVDWIVEAVVERLDVKRDLYRRVDAVRKPGSVVSSNTSTIPMSSLVEGMPDAFRADFLITHFFNPPRYMRLLELVAGPDSRAQAADAVGRFCDERLGKGVVRANDTPGFIGNRIGVYWLQVAALEAMEMGLSVEAADAVAGRPMGIPRTGVFGLLDLVGIDLMPHILASMDATLAADDPFREYARLPPLVERMIADGYTGRKGKGGFYRMRRDGGRRVKEAIDLATGEYRTSVEPSVEAVRAAREGGLAALVASDDVGGRYAARVLSRTLAYAASLVPEIADDVVAVDEAMRLGFNWRHGPFELIDTLGPAWLADDLRAQSRPVPPLLERAVAAGGFYRLSGGRREHLAVDGTWRPVERAPGVLLLEDVKLAHGPLARNGSASLWDLGDGVLCVEFHSKMNAIDADTLAMLRTAMERVASGHRALVIHNEGDNFSVGVNLGLALFAANIAAWDEIERLVEAGQRTYAALAAAPFPVVGAPAGMALGGGCEVLLHCDAIVAHAETYMGLVEVGVGLIPAWGGCTAMLARWAAEPKAPRGPMPAVGQCFESIGMAKVSRSAAEARALHFLRPQDQIVMNRDRVLAAAKQRALELATDYRSPEPTSLTLPGPSGAAALDLALHGLRLKGQATAHDAVVATALARVLSGGDADPTRPVDAETVRALERESFMGLIRQPATIARMEHMLETGKPLRN